MLPAKLYSEKVFFDRYLSDNWPNVRILNAGSAETRYGAQCVNIDIQAKPNVDIVGDIHSLPATIGLFDVVICNSVLQYCEDPRQVAHEFWRVLKPGGLLFVDVPWVQPYCPDTPDRYRYSADGLRSVFADFEIIETGPVIPAGSAFAMLGVRMAETLTRNRYVNFVLAKLVTALLYPFRGIQTARPEQTSGAFYLVARKPV